MAERHRLYRCAVASGRQDDACRPPPPPCRRPVVQAALVQSWIAADAGMKKQVKQNLLATLGTQVRLGWALGQPGGGCAAGA